jgi:hypothetical protein
MKKFIIIFGIILTNVGMSQFNTGIVDNSKPNRGTPPICKMLDRDISAPLEILGLTPPIGDICEEFSFGVTGITASTGDYAYFKKPLFVVNGLLSFDATVSEYGFNLGLSGEESVVFFEATTPSANNPILQIELQRRGSNRHMPWVINVIWNHPFKEYKSTVTSFEYQTLPSSFPIQFRYDGGTYYVVINDGDGIRPNYGIAPLPGLIARYGIVEINGSLSQDDSIIFYAEE